MEHVLIGGNELFMTTGGKKSYTVEDIERLPEGEREYWIVDPVQKSVTVYGLEKEEGPALHSFSAKVKAGIYEDLVLDFGEYGA